MGERLKAKMYVPVRDNLRLKAIAQYQALKDGDVLQYNAIEKRLVGNPSITGLALRCNSLE